jgi:hypothetical protein
MTKPGPTFIIEHEGRYYLTQGLWIYDVAQGTEEQMAGAKNVAALHAAVQHKTSAVLVPPEKNAASLGTAIHNTAIHNTAITG